MSARQGLGAKAFHEQRRHASVLRLTGRYFVAIVDQVANILKCLVGPIWVRFEVPRCCMTDYSLSRIFDHQRHHYSRMEVVSSLYSVYCSLHNLYQMNREYAHDIIHHHQTGTTTLPALTP